jgi:hypothetical protein
MLGPNGFYATCDGHELSASQGGTGCNWICNKVNALAAYTSPGGTPGLDRKHCKLLHAQAAANNVPCGNCSTVSVTPCLNTNFTDARIQHHANQGCYGTNGTQANPDPNSFCKKKQDFCGITNPSTMQQAKCDWLSGTYVWPSSCPPPTPSAPVCAC